MKVTGQVFKVYSKEFRGKPSFSIKLEDDPLYYRCNDRRYAGIAEPGNTVTFEAEPNPDGQSARVTSGVTLAAPPAPAAVATASAAAGSGGGSGLQMRYQGALERAILFVKLGIDSGAIVLPSAKAKKLGALEAYVDRYTALYFEDTNVLGALKREEEAASAPGEAADAEDEADDE